MQKKILGLVLAIFVAIAYLVYSGNISCEQSSDPMQTEVTPTACVQHDATGKCTRVEIVRHGNGADAGHAVLTPDEAAGLAKPK